jgi:hypothetical protein
MNSCFRKKETRSLFELPPHMCVAYRTKSLEVVFHVLPLSIFLPVWV